MENNFQNKKIFKVTVRQLINDIITLEELKVIFKKHKIDNRKKFITASIRKEIDVPTYLVLNEICLYKTNQNFEEYFQFKNSSKNEKKDTMAQHDEIITEIKAWCLEFEITSLEEYGLYKPERFPPVTIIVNKFGNDFFRTVLGLTNFEEMLRTKFLDTEFSDSIKNWCIENNINTIEKYNSTKKPEEIPHSETIIRMLGIEFMNSLLCTYSVKRTYLKMVEARNVCLLNRVYKLSDYLNFYLKYNDKNELKLPPNPEQFYNCTWNNFICIIV